MKDFQNSDYRQDIGRKIPGYDMMLELVFDIVLPATCKEQVTEVLAVASQLDELAGLAKRYDTPNITLVEPSSSMLEQVKQQNYFKEVCYIEDTLEKAPLKASSYQLCLCLLVLHFSPDPECFLRKIYDSLQEEGLLVLSLFSSEFLDYWSYFALANGVPQEQVDMVCQQGSEWLNALSAEQVENLLRSIGFSSIEKVCQILPTVVWLVKK